MSVLLANAQLTVAKRAPHPVGRDAHGYPMLPVTPSVTSGPFPGSTTEEPDGSYALRLDVRHWPVEPGDEVSDGTRTWVVVTRIMHTVPGAPDIDHVAATASLNPPKIV